MRISTLAKLFESAWRHDSSGSHCLTTLSHYLNKNWLISKGVCIICLTAILREVLMFLTVKVLVPHIQDPNLVLIVPVDALELGVRPSADTMRTPKLRYTCISFQVAIRFFKYSSADEATSFKMANEISWNRAALRLLTYNICMQRTYACRDCIFKIDATSPMGQCVKTQDI